MKNLSFNQFLGLLNKESELTNKTNYGEIYVEITEGYIKTKRELKESVLAEINECVWRLSQYRDNLFLCTWYMDERKLVIKEYYEKKLTKAKNIYNLIFKDETELNDIIKSHK